MSPGGDQTTFQRLHIRYGTRHTGDHGRHQNAPHGKGHIYGSQSQKRTGKNSSYACKGDTLKDLGAFIKKNGPLDPNAGKRYAGLAKCKADLSLAQKNFDFKVTKKGDKNEVEVTVKGAELKYTCDIVLPKLGASKIKGDAKKEWERFVKAVSTHEDGHVTEYEKEMKAAAKDVDKMKGKGKDKKEDKAKKAAFEDFKKQLNKLNLAQRITDNAKAYDASNGHGESQGAMLNMAIE